MTVARLHSERTVTRTLRLRLGTQSWQVPSRGVFRMGRHPSNDLVLNDRRVSRFHARIVWRGDQPVLEDCGSHNGTYVDGLALDGPLPLDDGQLVGLGAWDLTVELSEPPALIHDDESAFSFFGEDPEEELLGCFRSARDLHRVLLDLEAERRTGTLEVQVLGREGTVTLCLGRVVGARFLHLEGLPALERLLRSSRGRYRYVSTFELAENTLDVSVRQHLRDGFWVSTLRHRRAA